jgi:pimeloyl-ACP methyl ester carboxylesterase
MRPSSTVTLASGLTLSYAGQGDPSGPVLLLLPGPTDSWHSYQPVLDRLPPEIHAVAVSPRGHGDSDKPDRGYRIDDLAGDVPLLLDALEFDRAVLVGHSGSCLVARRAALDHPDRVAGLVLEAAPATLRNDDGARQFVRSLVADLQDPIGADVARSFVADTSSSDLPAAVVDELVDEVRKVPARVWREMFESLLQYDDTGELADLAAPTLLLWGDADAVVSREMQTVLLSRLPAAELKVYAGLGHTPRWEDPERFSDDVAAFVLRDELG